MEDADEARYVRARGLTCEWIFACKIDNRLRRTNHDLASERQLPGDCRAQNRLADIFADNKRPDCADVDDTELRQLLRDERRLASVRSTDIHCAKKYDASHSDARS